MIRLLGLLVGVTCGGLIVMFGLLMAVRVFWPQWYAVPGALLRMTSQQVVSAPPTTASQGTGLVQPAPKPTQVDAALSSAPEAVATLPPAPEADVQLTEEPTPAPVDDTSSGPAPAVLPDGRFNVLLLGSDNDLKFVPTAVLTQSMILVSIDPAANNVEMISIPRDFWVPIQGVGYQKIDVAYEVGGISLARSTVERLFGLKIDYYAWVGLDGLVRVIDTVGGVDVDVQHPILDETYPDDLNSTDPYAFFRLYLPAGPQHLDGTTALEYVRSRHGDLESDFGRSARQQQVLLALKNRLETPAMIGRLPELIDALQGSVKTDLSVPAILQLALLSRKLPADAIQRQVLSAPEFASLGYSPDGTQQIVIPNWAAIRPEIARLLKGGSSNSASASGSS